MSILKKGKPTSTKAEQLREELINGKTTVKFGMNIPRKLHQEFRRKAFLNDIDMKDVLIEAIHAFLKK